MTQTREVKVKLLPTKGKIRLLEKSSHEYIRLINTLVSEMADAKKRTKDIEAKLPRRRIFSAFNFEYL